MNFLGLVVRVFWEQKVSACLVYINNTLGQSTIHMYVIHEPRVLLDINMSQRGKPVTDSHLLHHHRNTDIQLLERSP